MHPCIQLLAGPTIHCTLPAVREATDKCLLALKRIKTEGSQRKRKAKEEVSSLFKKKCNKGEGKCVWKHRFVCLAYPDQYKIPITDVEKDDLLQAGLGEKEVEFALLELDAEEFRKVLQIVSTVGECRGISVLQVCPE